MFSVFANARVGSALRCVQITLNAGKRALAVVLWARIDKAKLRSILLGRVCGRAVVTPTLTDSRITEGEAFGSVLVGELLLILLAIWDLNRTGTS